MTAAPEPIFIVGQYKCGTSWLQRCLAAHPDMVGVSEFDMVKATTVVTPRDAKVRSAPDRLAEFFDRSGWCTRWDGERWLHRDAVARLAAGEDHAQRPPDEDRLQKFDNLTPEAAHRLYERVNAATHPFEAMDAWLEAVSEPWAGKSHIVLKAADQVVGFRVLQAWRPDAPKLFITRDGRDASISEEHYRSLMAERDAPWQKPIAARDYARRVEIWANRAALAGEYAGRGELTVIRYEDLSTDFAATLGGVLDGVGAATDATTIASIQERTSFAAMTNRQRGEAATSTIRKGSVGEFTEVVAPDDREAAWAVAGPTLAALGYGRDGDIGPITPSYTDPGSRPTAERADGDRGWIEARPNPRPPDDGRRHRVRIRWATTNRRPGYVGVRTVRGGERRIGQGRRGTRRVGWIRPECSFVVTLYAEADLTDPIASIVLRRARPDELFTW